MRIFPTVPGFNGLSFNNTDGGIGYDDYLSLDLNFALTKTLEPRVTFSRSSGATNIGPAGLVEWAPENLLTRSGEFNTAPWATLNGTATPTTVLDPTDGLAAYSFVENTASGNHQIFQTLNTAIGVQTFSIFIKAAGRTSCQLLLFNATNGSFGRVNVDLSTGALSSVIGSASVQQFSNDWWRVSVTGTSTVLASSVNILLVNNDTTSYTGNGVSGVLLYGAQIQRGTSPTAYIITTTSAVYGPRFAHNPVTLASQGLLIEEARTNLFARSEEFSDAYWTKTRLSISANATTAPDGVVTADKLVEDTSTGSHEISRAINVTSGQAYTFSIFIKKAERSRVSMELPFSFPAGASAVFDADAGTVVSTGAAATASISALPNGFYRCVLTATANATATGTLYLKLVDTGTNTSYTGDGTSGLFIWGAGAEAGSFVTSYIATTTASATRAADVATITGPNFSSWFKQAAGTIAVNYAPPPIPFPSSPRFESVFRFGPSAERWGLLNGGSTLNYQTQVFRGGVFIGSSAAVPQSSSMAYAFAWDVSGHAQSYNATAATTSSVSPTTNVNTELLIGTSNLCGTIARIRFYNRRLPNASIQIIST
jgi:hypothetical protein